MRLELQVCSLELAKKLKELGVLQYSLFYWWGKMEGSGSPSSPYKEVDGFLLLGNTEINQITRGSVGVYGIEDKSHCFDKKYSAFTSSELGEIFNDNNIRSGQYNDDKWVCYNEDHTEHADTEVNARAKMLVYLLKNKLIFL